MIIKFEIFTFYELLKLQFERENQSHEPFRLIDGNFEKKFTWVKITVSIQYDAINVRLLILFVSLIIFLLWNSWK